MQAERSWVQIPKGAERNGVGSFEARAGVGVGVVVGGGGGAIHGIFGVGK